MKSFSLPILLTAGAALIALGFDGTAGLTLGLTASLGAIIRIDYSQRYRGLALPLSRQPSCPATRLAHFPSEPHRLAA